MKLLLIGGALTYAASRLFKTANTGKNLEYKITGVKWQGFKHGALKLNVNISFFNPTDYILTVNYLHLNIFIEKFQIATIDKLNWNFPVNAAQNSNATIPVSIYLTDALWLLATNVGKLLRNGKMPEYLKIKGNIKADGLVLPVDEQIKVTGNE